MKRRSTARERSADPYSDLGVIDARAARLNQAVIGSLALAAFLSGWWPLLAVAAGQLAVSLVFGRRYCLACRLWFGVLQPVLGEGEVEDARPPRFANAVGVTVLTAALAAHSAGATVLAWSLALLVAALALFAAATGICVGCDAYKALAYLRGIHAGALERIDLSELGAQPLDGLVVHFSHPLCSACRELEERLRDDGRHVVTVDVSRRRPLAEKYGIAVVPTTVALAADGSVTARLA
ncbi:MAG: DUF4395 family protein [Gaiellales bacterium]